MESQDHPNREESPADAVPLEVIRDDAPPAPIPDEAPSVAGIPGAPALEVIRDDEPPAAPPPGDPPLDDTPPEAAAEASGGLLAFFWLLAPLLLLILARAVLIHGDPTDFPLDRNISAAVYNQRFVRETALDKLELSWSHFAPLFKQPEAPEFPFMPVVARLLAFGGVAPVVAGRLFSLFCAVLTAVGLFVLGERLHSRGVGLAAVWLYALMPFSIFMGRSLLPDSLMVAALVWSFAVAGAPAGGSDWGRVRRTACWLILAGLAKLPAIFFAPVAALLMMDRLGWRRPSSYLKVALTAGLTFLVVAWWYDLWHPVAGLARLSAGTNNIISTAAALSPVRTLWVAAMRIVLALSLPGILLALLGAGLLQSRRGRLPFNVWLLLALVFVPLTARANTYWVYPIMPLGCLLGGVALIDVGRLFPRLPLALVLAVLFWLCPSIATVEDYLAVAPEYRELSADAERVMTKPGRVYFLGRLPSALQYFVQRPGYGTGAAVSNPDSVMGELRRREYPYLVSNHLIDNGALEALFASKPVLAHRLGKFVIFGTGNAAAIGETVPLTPEAPVHPALDLGGMLVIRDASYSPATVKPGAKLELSVVFSEGRGFQPQLPPNLSLGFIHEATGECFHLPPASGGMMMFNWAFPFLQTPDFLSTATLVRMRYTFQIPQQMPAGRYQLRFALLSDKGRTTGVAKPQTLSYLPLEIEPPSPLARLPLTVPLEDGIWRVPVISTRLSWMGQARQVASMSKNSLVLRPALPAGEYQLTITARGVPVGAANNDRWPVLNVLRPAGSGPPVNHTINSEQARTYTTRFQWKGPQDFLRLEMNNPRIEATPDDVFLLYMDDIPRARKAVIEKIVISKPGANGS